jgi:hypothetical protein
MIMSASARAAAAPPMSLRMSSIEAGGLMSRPPVSKATPLPTIVTLGASAAPQAISTSRGGVAAARPTAMDHRDVLRQQVLAHDARERGAVPVGDAARRRLDPVGSEVVGRRVDEVAAEGDRVGDPRGLRGIDALRRHEADALLGLRAVAGEGVAAQEPGQRRERRVRRRVREAVVALGQEADELAGQERVGPLRGRPVEPEGRAEDAAVRIRQQADLPGLALEGLRGGKGPGLRRQVRGDAGPALLGDEPDGAGMVGVRGEEGMGHGIRLGFRGRSTGWF